MASANANTQGNASPISDKNLMIGELCIIVFLLSACSYVDLSVKHLNLNKSKATSDQLAILRIDHDDDDLTQPYALELVRTHGVQKGYTVRTNLYHDEEGSVHLAVGKQKEYKWFFGIQGRWTF